MAGGLVCSRGCVLTFMVSFWMKEEGGGARTSGNKRCVCHLPSRCRAFRICSARLATILLACEGTRVLVAGSSLASSFPKKRVEPLLGVACACVRGGGRHVSFLVPSMFLWKSQACLLLTLLQ